MWPYNGLDGLWEAACAGNGVMSTLVRWLWGRRNRRPGLEVVLLLGCGLWLVDGCGTDITSGLPGGDSLAVTADDDGTAGSRTDGSEARDQDLEVGGGSSDQPTNASATDEVDVGEYYYYYDPEDDSLYKYYWSQDGWYEAEWDDDGWFKDDWDDGGAYEAWWDADGWYISYWDDIGWYTAWWDDEGWYIDWWDDVGWYEEWWAQDGWFEEYLRRRGAP